MGSLLTRFRLNVPLQYVGYVLTFMRAMSQYLLLFVIVWHIDPHWLVWLLYWWTTFLAALCWALYSLLDVDGDGAEGVE